MLNLLILFEQMLPECDSVIYIVIVFPVFPEVAERHFSALITLNVLEQTPHITEILASNFCSIWSGVEWDTGIADRRERQDVTVPLLGKCVDVAKLSINLNCIHEILELPYKIQTSKGVTLQNAANRNIRYYSSGDSLLSETPSIFWGCFAIHGVSIDAQDWKQGWLKSDAWEAAIVRRTFSYTAPKRFVS